MSAQQSSDSKKLQLTLQQKISILLSFSKDKVVEQIQCVWFIILYLIVFQVLVLGLPIVYSLMIAVGIIIVIIGLAFFYGGSASWTNAPRRIAGIYLAKEEKNSRNSVFAG